MRVCALLITSIDRLTNEKISVSGRLKAEKMISKGCTMTMIWDPVPGRHGACFEFALGAELWYTYVGMKKLFL